MESFSHFFVFQRIDLNFGVWAHLLVTIATRNDLSVLISDDNPYKYLKFQKVWSKSVESFMRYLAKTLRVQGAILPFSSSSRFKSQRCTYNLRVDDSLYFRKL